VQISVLRKRLGDSADDHRFISTVPGRGYQFVATVTEVAVADVMGSASEAAPRPEIVWRRTESNRRGWRWARVAAASVLAVTCTVWYRATPTPAPSASSSGTALSEPSPEAKRLYQRGRHMLGKRTSEALRRGIAHFESALAHDPEFALAHTGLADAYSMLGYFGFAAPREVVPLAQAAASKALDLNPDSAAAQTSRAYIQHRYEWRFGEAERSFIRAITLEPDYALARHWYGSYLESMNRYEEAIEQSAKAEELEPVSPVISANLAGILSSARHPTLAQAQWDKALELDEGFWPAHQALAEIYAGRDMPLQALDAFRRSIALSGENPKQVAALARFHVATGNVREAQRLRAELESRASREWVSPADIASIHAVLGNKDEAFRWLEHAVAERDPMIAYLAESRLWRALRRDQRYADLLRRVGLDRVALNVKLDAAGR
jgi:Tfp pilus assembly protein PilF